MYSFIIIYLLYIIFIYLYFNFIFISLTTVSECDNLGFSKRGIIQTLPLNQEDSGPGFMQRTYNNYHIVQ